MSSNVSLEEPRALVQQLVTKFLPENDMSSIQAVSSNFNQLLTVRKKKIAQSRETLQRKEEFSFFIGFVKNIFFSVVWIKKVEAAKWESQRPSEKSEQKHMERIGEIEKERFALVKQIEDFELSTQQFTAILAQSTDQAVRLKHANEKSSKLTINPIEYFISIKIDDFIFIYLFI